MLLFGACAGGFDSADTCEQTAACVQKIQGTKATSAEIDQCAGILDEVYDGAPSEAQDRLDDAYEACEGKSSCDFFACFCDEAGTNTTECEEARANR